MSPPRVSSPSSSATNLCTDNDVSSLEPRPSKANEPATSNRSTVEMWSATGTPGFGASQPAPGPTSNTTRFGLEQALAKQELQEKALRELTPILSDAVKNMGRLHANTFVTNREQTELKNALRTLSPEQCEAVAREAVQRAFPKAPEAEVASLTQKTMQELKSVTTSAMARDLKDFVGHKLTVGADTLRGAANDPDKLRSMLAHLDGLGGEVRTQTLQSWGLSPEVRQPTTQQLSVALVERAALMDQSAKGLAQTSGADTTLYRLASYPGVAQLFAREKKLDPDSVGGRALAQAQVDAKHEKNVRLGGDVALALTSAVAFSSVAAAVGAGAGGAVLLAAPVTLANTARKLGAEENAVNAAKAGTSAGVMGRDGISKAEEHRRNVALAAIAELAAPAGGHALAHSAHVESIVGHAALDAGLTGIIGGVEILSAPHADEAPTGRDSTQR